VGNWSMSRSLSIIYEPFSVICEIATRIGLDDFLRFRIFLECTTQTLHANSSRHPSAQKRRQVTARKLVTNSLSFSRFG